MNRENGIYRFKLRIPPTSTTNLNYFKKKLLI